MVELSSVQPKYPLKCLRRNIALSVIGRFSWFGTSARPELSRGFSKHVHQQVLEVFHQIRKE